MQEAELYHHKIPNRHRFPLETIKHSTSHLDAHKKKRKLHTSRIYE